MNLPWLTAETTSLLLQGLSLTLWMTLLTSMAAVFIGVILGLWRLSRKPLLRFFSLILIEVHRNIPALVLVIFWAFALPTGFPEEIRSTIFFDNPLMRALERFTGLSLPYYTIAAGFGLTLNASAYIAELFRAGVGSLPQSHLDAARTLGAGDGVITLKILIPQGIRAAFPGITTRLIHNMKNTALVSLVSAPDLFHSTQSAISRTFHAVELLTLTALTYLGLSFVLSKFLQLIERYLLHPPRKKIYRPRQRDRKVVLR